MLGGQQSIVEGTWSATKEYDLRNLLMTLVNGRRKSWVSFYAVHHSPVDSPATWRFHTREKFQTVAASAFSGKSCGSKLKAVLSSLLFHFLLNFNPPDFAVSQKKRFYALSASRCAREIWNLTKSFEVINKMKWKMFSNHRRELNTN